MKFKEFILETSIYNNDTIDTMLNDYFEDKEVRIDDVKYAVFKECDSSNALYIRVLILYWDLSDLD